MKTKVFRVIISKPNGNISVLLEGRFDMLDGRPVLTIHQATDYARRFLAKDDEDVTVRDVTETIYDEIPDLEEAQNIRAEKELAIQRIIWLPIEEAPKDQPLWLWSEEFVDEDFNPTGVMDGYWDEHFDDIPGGSWVVAGWDSCHDVYGSYPACPTHFAYKVMPNAKAKRKKAKEVEQD